MLQGKAMSLPVLSVNILSINPDAHRTEGLLDMQYGINVARKGGLTKNDCLNSFSLREIESFFKSKKA